MCEERLTLSIYTPGKIKQVSKEKKDHTQIKNDSSELFTVLINLYIEYVKYRCVGSARLSTYTHVQLKRTCVHMQLLILISRSVSSIFYTCTQPRYHKSYKSLRFLFSWKTSPQPVPASLHNGNTLKFWINAI